jgi:hypothetical protein
MLGVVRDHEKRFWSKVEHSLEDDECWEWKAGKAKDGYGEIEIKGVNYPAHRLAYYFHYGVNPESNFVLHSCDNPGCCNPSHLFLGDALANAQDRESKGRGNHFRGEDCKSAKLMDSEVAEIRNSNERGDYLAIKYNVSEALISLIKNYKTRVPV